MLNEFEGVLRALRDIRDRRLYRQTHRCFADYCRERWGLSEELIELIEWDKGAAGGEEVIAD